MTEAIQNTANRYAAGDFEIICKSTLKAPFFIETFEDEIKTAPGMIDLIRKNENNVDAFVIACHDDPILDVLKEITSKVVIGIGEASMKIASMLGHKFSVISTSKHGIPIKEDQIRKYSLYNNIASIRAPSDDFIELSEEEKYLETAKLAIEEDQAEVIVLGCAGMAGLDKNLQEKLGVPVLDGIVCALIIASGLVKYGVSTSKIRKYNPNWT